MIRKAIIILLTLAAVGTIAAWVVSHTVQAIDVDKDTVAYSYGRDYSFLEPTDPNEGMWLRVAVSGGTLHLNRWNSNAPRRVPASRRWRLLRFSFVTGAYTGTKPPYSFWLLEVPLWCPIVLFAAYPVLAFIRGPVRRYRRRKRGLCTRCGYNLTGLTEPRCPECGTGFGRTPGVPSVDHSTEEA
jgi:hypothetical protein